MEIDVECDFADIVDALDPDDPINQQRTESTKPDNQSDAALDLSNSESPKAVPSQSTIKSMIKSAHRTRQQSKHSVSTLKSSKSESKISNGMGHDLKKNVVSIPHELAASTKFIQKLRIRRQKAMTKLRDDIISKKSNGDIFGYNNQSEPTLRCPWCGDNKGYRYFTKHLHLKCQSKPAHLKQRAVSTRQTRSRVNKATLKQLMNNSDDTDEETVKLEQEKVSPVNDDYNVTVPQKKKRSSARLRRNPNRQVIVDEDYAPRRSKRKR